MSGKTRLNADIVSDVMCPWRHIGRKRLEKALDQVPDIDADIHWRPFQLDPTLPPEGKDRKQYLSEKFGGDDRAGTIYRAIGEAGAAEGIPFDFEAIGVSPNTLDAHRLIRWASGDGVQDGLARRLFWLYFEEGAHIGNHNVPIEAARDAGMDAAIVESLLATDCDREKRNRNRQPDGHNGRSVLSDRGEVRHHGRPGRRYAGRRVPSDRGSQTAGLSGFRRRLIYRAGAASASFASLVTIAAAPDSLFSASGQSLLNTTL